MLLDGRPLSRLLGLGSLLSLLLLLDNPQFLDLLFLLSFLLFDLFFLPALPFELLLQLLLLVDLLLAGWVNLFLGNDKLGDLRLGWDGQSRLV